MGLNVLGYQSHLLCRNVAILIMPVVTKDLPIPPRFSPYEFLSRCKVSTLTTRQPMVEFYLLASSRFLFRYGRATVAPVVQLVTSKPSDVGT